MVKVLDGLEFCIVYVDDVLIGSKTQEEHVQHLREVHSRLEEHGIILNGEKCVLGVLEVQFLGHMVSARGIIPLPEKVATICAFPRPGTVGQLMSYLGIEWSTPMLEAFKGSKQQMVSATHLAHPGKRATLACLWMLLART